MKTFFVMASFLVVSILTALTAGIRSMPADSEAPSTATKSESATMPAEDTAVEPAAASSDIAAADEIPAEAMQPAKPVKVLPQETSATRADAFIAGADWEFDGFVAGGQDSKVRSMFYLNDLLYLNIGSQQGIVTGDKLEIYKRGDKVRDPQNGRFLGYEVRRAAVVRATDRIEDDACAVRVIRSHEAVEIGDLVRRVQ